MIELAWAAGFYDGEGCTSVHRTNGNHNLRISIQQIDPRPLQRFLNAIEGGNLGGPYKSPSRKTSWSAQWHYYLTGVKALGALGKLWPYLSEPKQEQILYIANQMELATEQMTRCIIQAYKGYE